MGLPIKCVAVGGSLITLLNYLKVKYLFSNGFIASIDGTARSIDMSLFIQHFISISILLNIICLKLLYSF